MGTGPQEKSTEKVMQGEVSALLAKLEDSEGDDSYCWTDVLKVTSTCDVLWPVFLGGGKFHPFVPICLEVSTMHRAPPHPSP